MRILKSRIWAIVLAVFFVACDKQRDLYDISSPLLRIEGDWKPSLGKDDMGGRATAMIYNGDDVKTEFFYHSNALSAKVSCGEYDILLFNGLMFSEENTNLDHIFFRNTGKLKTFEAVVVNVAGNQRLARLENEYIASNEMELLTSGLQTIYVEGENQYYLKYKNGQNGYPVLPDYIENGIGITPILVNYLSKVVVHLTNPSNSAIANGALRGFVGSVFMNSCEPSNFDVTHHLRLNNLIITNKGTKGDPNDPERGTIESPLFVTFGPPLNMPGRKYSFELSIILKDGQTIEKTFDITAQVEVAIQTIIEHRKNPDMVLTELHIPIEISIELPEVINPELSIGVNDWGDDEIIHIKI